MNFYVIIFIIGGLAIVYLLLKERMEYLSGNVPANVDYPTIDYGNHKHNYLLYIIGGIILLGILYKLGYIKVK